MPGGGRVRWFRPLMVALGALGVGIGVPTGAEVAFATTAPQVTLVDDVGEGFVADAPVNGALGSQTRTYRHPQGELTLQGNVLPKGLSATTFIDAYVATVGTDIPEVPVPTVTGGRGFHLGKAGEVQISSLIFASADAVFVATLRSDPGASWNPMELLEHVANLQIQQSGGVATLTPAVQIPAGSGPLPAVQILRRRSVRSAQRVRGKRRPQ